MRVVPSRATAFCVADLLFERTGGDSCGDVTLRDRKQERGRDRGDQGSCHDRRPLNGESADEPVDPYGDRREVGIVVEDECKQKVAPAKQECEQAGRDQRSLAKGQDD